MANLVGGLTGGVSPHSSSAASPNALFRQEPSPVVASGSSPQVLFAQLQQYQQQAQNVGEVLSAQLVAPSPSPSHRAFPERSPFPRTRALPPALSPGGVSAAGAREEPHDVFLEYGAPIRRYRDPRLYGYTLMQPLEYLYRSWVQPIRNVFDPTQNRVLEFARRFFSMVVGLGLMVLGAPLLVGRLIQVLHYHALSTKQLDRPPFVTGDDGWRPSISAKFYKDRIDEHNASLESAISHNHAISIKWRYNCSSQETIRGLRGNQQALASIVNKRDFTSQVNPLGFENQTRCMEFSFNFSEKESLVVNEPTFQELRGDLAKQHRLYLNGFRLIGNLKDSILLDLRLLNITQIEDVLTPPCTL